MEKEKTKIKQGKRKTQISSNGRGNLGGLLLLGGALAVGSLVATLAAWKGHKRKDSEDKRHSGKQKEDQPTPGLHIILQTSSPSFHGNQCCANNGSTETVASQLKPSQLVSADSLMLEENRSSAVNGYRKSSENSDQEIPVIHDLKKDSIEMRDSHYLAEDYQLPELIILSLDVLDKDAKNSMATIEFAEDDAIDAVKISTEEITSVKPAKEDSNDKEEKKQAKESLLLEKNIQVAETEEPTTVKSGVEKVDDVMNSEKESALKITEVKKDEEAIDKVEDEYIIDAVKISIEEISSGQSAYEEDEEERKLLLEEIIVDEEEAVSLEACAEDDGDGNFKKGLPLLKIIEVEQEIIDEVAEDNAMDAARMCIEENWSSKSTEDDIEEAEEKISIGEKEYHKDKDQRSVDELVLNKSIEKTGGIESSCEGSAADEIWAAGSVEATPQDLPNSAINAKLSQVKTAEQDKNNKTEDFNHFNNSKNHSINSGTDFNRTTFTRKEGSLDSAVWNKQTTMHSRKWKISVEHILIMASIVILFITYCNARFFLSSLYS